MFMRAVPRVSGMIQEMPETFYVDPGTAPISLYPDTGVDSPVSPVPVSAPVPGSAVQAPSATLEYTWLAPTNPVYPSAPLMQPAYVPPAASAPNDNRVNDVMVFLSILSSLVLLLRK